MLRKGPIACTLLIAAAAVPLAAQTRPIPQEPAVQLVRDVVYNELHDRERDSHWEYLTTTTASGRQLEGEQVETSHGIVFRLLARDGVLLSAADQLQETQRIHDLIRNSSAMAHKVRDHQADEHRLASLTRMLPTAFVYRYQAPPSGDIVRLAFRPNPSFDPSSYEARIVHALAGTMTVNLRYKRLIDIRGVVSQPVEFGFGLLGHIEQGGTFEIHRRQVSSLHWKTDLVDVHIAGKLLLFKTVAKNEREVRSDFQPVPQDLTLAQASNLLSQAAADPSVLAQLSPGPADAESAPADTDVSSDP